MDLKSLIDKPIQLIEFMDECLHPKENEKKQFGEVFTPMKWVNIMLDVLPSSVWNNPNLKWLDPACGMGNFPIAIYQRLMKGLKQVISDKEKRKKHILEKMLYMCELNTKNVFLCKQIFDLGNKYRLNLLCKDSLTTDFTELNWPGKFDIVVGNPPYNQELTRTGALPLYNKFIDRYIDMCRYMLFIVPSRWFAGGKGLDQFRKNMLARTDIKSITHIDNASEIFGNSVDIKGGVNYFLKDSKHDGKCDFNGTLIQLNKFDVLISDSKYYKIITKLSDMDLLNKLYKGRSFGIESNDKRLRDAEKKNMIKCYVSKQKGFEKYINPAGIKAEYKYWKVVTARASFEHGSGFGNMFIASPNEVHTGSYISFKVKNKSAAKSLLSYMKCKLPNLMLSLRKISQDINESTCSWIPLPKLDRIWSDAEVYKYFKLSSAEIKLTNKAEIKGYKPIKKLNKQIDISSSDEDTVQKVKSKKDKNDSNDDKTKGKMTSGKAKKSSTNKTSKRSD